MIEKIFFNLEKCREKYIFLHEGQTWISSCEIWKPVRKKRENVQTKISVVRE